MVIGKHACKDARKADSLKAAIKIALDDALTGLEESFCDLSDEQTRVFAIPGRNCIAWIVTHALQNLDEYTNLAHGGRPTFEHQQRWDLWECSPDERPKPGDPFPSQAQMMGWLRSIRATSERTLEGVDDARLVSKPDGHWPGNVAGFYMRTIFHTMAHVRQVWLLRGALGLTDGKSWPQQHWA
jgi:hypothetical protein